MARSTILLADNHPEFLQTYGEFLTEAGFNVKTASDPERAQAIMERVRLF